MKQERKKKEEIKSRKHSGKVSFKVKGDKG